MLLVTFNLCKECNNFKKRYSFHLDSSVQLPFYFHVLNFSVHLLSIQKSGRVQQTKQRLWQRLTQ